MALRSPSQVLDRRRAGVLLHPTSLPGGVGCGDLGPEAYHFVDFLEHCGASVWQVLPLGPTHEDLSPYMSLSVLAGNPWLISLEVLKQWGWLKRDCVAAASDDPTSFRQKCLLEARQGFLQHAAEQDRQDYQQFIQLHQYWLDDFALFQAIREQQQGKSWVDWPEVLRDRQAEAMDEVRHQLADAVDQTRFEQFVFYRQWHAVRDYANERGIRVFGDMPIFVAHDSAEVWANRNCFDLYEDGQPRTVAGVPPDYFSETGQRWGNPHYDWKYMKQDGFNWWVNRMRGTLELFDLIRVDHFRGFESYWEIKADAETAIDGRWVKTPGKALFNALLASFDQLPFVAEDLGTITPEVDALREKYGWPGMKILQFAFGGGAANPYLPHNHEANSVVYTGTHDNDTTVGWYNGLDPKTQQHISRYLAYSDEAMPWALIRAALASVAWLAVIPMQDLLALGEGQRMNTPGSNVDENWRWRFQWSQVEDELPKRLKALIKLYGR
jgi:4-alpha-glucanotransferase